MLKFENVTGNVEVRTNEHYHNGMAELLTSDFLKLTKSNGETMYFHSSEVESIYKVISMPHFGHTTCHRCRRDYRTATCPNCR